MEALLSIDKAAEKLGLSPWTLRLYLRQGKLRPVRIGRRVLLEEAELSRFIAECRDTVESEDKHRTNYEEKQCA